DVCFFFQAEDGIRDLTVTGVQTCALPIFFVAPGYCNSPFALPDDRKAQGQCQNLPRTDAHLLRSAIAGHYCAYTALQTDRLLEKIGRASCREGVERWGSEGCLKKEGG